MKKTKVAKEDKSEKSVKSKDKKAVSKEIAMVPVKLGEKTRLQISVSKYEGKYQFGARVFYESKGEWKPTRQGFSVPLAKSVKVRKAIRSVLDAAKEKGLM